MKKNMMNVLVDRARSDSSHRCKKGFMRLLQRPDDLPSREPMSPGRHGWDDNSRLFRAPLERFLRKQVGRLWDDVYSEICADAPANSALGRRLREEVSWLVETNVTVKGGELICQPYGYKVGGLYVHPETGLLCLPAPSPRRRYKFRKDYEIVDVEGTDKHKYLRLGGLWYKVELAPLPEDQAAVQAMPEHKRLDVVSKLPFFGHERAEKYGNRFRQLWGADVYACAKQQVGKKEIAIIERKLAGENVNVTVVSRRVEQFHRPCGGRS